MCQLYEFDNNCSLFLVLLLLFPCLLEHTSKEKEDHNRKIVHLFTYAFFYFDFLNYFGMLLQFFWSERVVNFCFLFVIIIIYDIRLFFSWVRFRTNYHLTFVQGWISIGSLDGFLYSFSPTGDLKKSLELTATYSVIQASPVLDCSGFGVYVSQTLMDAKSSQTISNYTYISAMKPIDNLFTLLAPATGTVYWSGKYIGMSIKVKIVCSLALVLVFQSWFL